MEFMIDKNYFGSKYKILRLFESEDFLVAGEIN